MSGKVEVRHPTSGRSAVVASIPHSGLHLPNEIVRDLRVPVSALANSDWYLDDVYAFLPEIGVTVVSTSFSRYFADVNRNPTRGAGHFRDSPVPLTTWDGLEIYARSPTDRDVAARIKLAHDQFHRLLAAQVEASIQEFGFCVLLDLHSFAGPRIADAIVGDAHQTTSDGVLSSVLRAELADEGMSVAYNEVYPGGWIVRSHGARPQVDAIQLEICYDTYLPPHEIDTGRQPTLTMQTIREASNRLCAGLTRFVQRVATRDAIGRDTD